MHSITIKDHSSNPNAERPVTGLDYEFARLGLEDLEDLTALEKICFLHPWKKEHFWLGLAKGAFYVFGLKNAGQTAAYLAFSRKTNTMEILKLAVHPDHRRAGLAKRLLGLVLKIGSEMGIRHARLELRQSNATALNLYAHFNFTQTGVKEKYYPDTGEDALNLFLDLNAMGENR
ncbi:MAG: GNAT family N-acetyltransferase [Thermodesulfobacteriota bacterium]|nr:GNAT family N-acetyltransferase [Thermodesulfobacteriota bacterium]